VVSEFAFHTFNYPKDHKQNEENKTLTRI